jgi:MFS family permease
LVSHRRKRTILKTSVVSFIVYAVLNLLAMLLYPGGTSLHKDVKGYLFFENFFSDLGMVRTYGGQPNTFSMLLFASALVLMGIAFIFFFVLMPSYFTATRPERVASRVGSIAGVLAGVSCIGIAATPWDLYLDAHLIFAYGLSASFLLSVVFYPVAMLANRRYPNTYAMVFAVYTIILGAYLGLMLLGPDMGTEEGLKILATGQKTAIYLGMICWFVQFLGAYKHHKRHSQWHQQRQAV